MTINNNRGFMMAEVVIVSVIVATTLLVLYISTNRVTAAFNLRNKYHDLDCLNLSVAVNNYLIENGEINALLQSKVISQSINTEVGDIKKLFNNYNGVNVFFIKNNNGIDTSSLTGVRNTTTKYFEYLNKNVDENVNYYIVSEICTNEDNCFYYGLGVR